MEFSACYQTPISHDRCLYAFFSVNLQNNREIPIISRHKYYTDNRTPTFIIELARVQTDFFKRIFLKIYFRGCEHVNGRTTFGSQFSPALWVLGTEFRLVLGAILMAHQALDVAVEHDEYKESFYICYW